MAQNIAENRWDLKGPKLLPFSRWVKYKFFLSLDNEISWPKTLVKPGFCSSRYGLNIRPSLSFKVIVSMQPFFFFFFFKQIKYFEITLLSRREMELRCKGQTRTPWPTRDVKKSCIGADRFIRHDLIKFSLNHEDLISSERRKLDLLYIFLNLL